MKSTYIITGAGGHVGAALIRLLESEGESEIRALALPGERICGERAKRFEGDVRRPETLREIFSGINPAQTCVIHAAGIVDISKRGAPGIRDVNVQGTRNIIALCREYKVRRLIYVSSVHAIPETAGEISEASHFSPDSVSGAYARTKAEATQAVLDAAHAGLDAVIVQPSGILGPFSGSGNYLVQMVKDYLGGLLPACVNGGYDLVDVRDVARGCLLAARYGRSGECYILSNRRYDIKDVLELVRAQFGGKRLPVLPMWLARAAAPTMQLYARVKRERALYTSYSLYALSSNSNFSHAKATRELGYAPRDIKSTITDTVLWLKGGAGASAIKPT